MSCLITPEIKNEQGNWEPSKLFIELNTNFGYDKALAIYKGIHSDTFIDTFGDWINNPSGLAVNTQNEPTYESIKAQYGLSNQNVFSSLTGFSIGKTKGQIEAKEKLSSLEKAESKLQNELTELTRLDIRGNNRVQIKELTDLLEELDNQKTLIPLLSFAEDQIKPIVTKLDLLNTTDTKAYTYKELNDILKRINFFGSALSGGEFESNNKDLIKRRNLLNGTIHEELKPKILRLIEAKIVDVAAQDFNPDLLKAVMNFITKEIGASKETTWIERMTLDSSKAVDIINKLADFYSLQTENQINQELQNRTTAITSAYDAIIKAKKNIEDVYELMYEKGKRKNGDIYQTGRIVTKYNAEYTKLANTRNKAIKSKSKDVRVKYLESWIDNMTLKPIDRTEYDKAEAQQALVLNQKELDQWKVTHDPDVYKSYLDRFIAGDRSNEVVNGILNFDKAINIEGAAFFKFTPSENLLDQQFKAIHADPLASVFYDAYTELVEKSQNDLPSRFLDGKLIPKNYIFELKKSLYEELAGDSYYRILTNKVRLGVLNSITENDNSENYIYKDPYTGQKSYGLYVRNQRNLPLNLKSKNLYNIAVTQAALAIEFKRKAELEPVLLLFREVSKIKPVINIKGEAVIKKDNEDNNNVKMLEFRLNKTLYGKGNVTEGGKLNVKVYTDEDKVKIKSFEAELEKEKANREQAIADKQTKTKINEIEVKIAALEKQLFQMGNMISYRQVADTISDYTRKKGLAMNFVSATTDAIFGFVSASTEGKRFGINPKNAAISYKLAMQSLVTRTISGKDKVRGFADMFDVETKLNEYKYNSKVAGQKHVIDKVFNADNFFLFQTISGKINAYATMIAILRANKVPGTDTSIYDAFDKDGKWKLTIPNPYESQQDNEGNFIPNGEVTKLSLLINDTITSIHGNYDTKKPVEGKKEWYGRASIVFKSWLPNSVQNRIGRHQIDLLSNIETKGRYRSIFNKGGFFRADNGKFGFNRSMKNALSLIGYGASEMNELDTKNMQANFYEAVAAAFMLGVALLLSSISMGDDDDDEGLSVYTYLVNQNNRVMKDLSFYYNPIGFKKLLDINTLMPAMGTLNDFGNIFLLTGRTLFDSKYKPMIERGVDKGENRLTNKITDQIPVYFGIERSLDFVTTPKKSKKK